MRAVAIVLFAWMVCCASIQPSLAADSAKFTEKVLYSFCNKRNCKDGAYPEAPVIAVNGILYGTTYGGGRGVACYYPGCGTVFSLDPSMGVETVLHSFCRQLFCPDGAFPFDVDLIDVKGTLYGTTFEGGDNACGYNNIGCGIVFSLNPGTGAENTVYAFCSQSKYNCTDGQYPQGDMVHVRGTIYGTTQGGGSEGMGTVFALDTKTGAETVLYSFCASGYPCTDGFNPTGLIVVNGTLYGTTLQGGVYKCDQGEDCGTAYSLDPNTGVHTVLHSFGSSTDGWYANGLIALNGILYGTTNGGETTGCGGFGCGIVFSIDPSTGAETVLYSFCSQQNCTDGANPFGGLIEVKGMLYGTTSTGGSTGCGGSGCGTVFSIDPSTGSEAVPYSFSGAPSDGQSPDGVTNVNGTFYGTTEAGGAYGDGTVFVLTKTR